MYVSIHSEKRGFLRNRQKDFGGFYPHSRKLYEFFYGFWRKWVMLTDEYLAGFIDIFCLVIKKWDRVDKICNLFHSHTNSVFWSFEMFKKISINNIHLFIRCLRGHKNCDE